MIYIDGDEPTLLGLQDIPDMILQFAAAEVLAGGQVRIPAYATDRAVTEIEGRGATVTIVFDNDALQTRMDELIGQIDGGGVV